MDKKRINLIHGISIFALGILMILIGLFADQFSHEWRIVISIAQILIGGSVLVTSVLKIKGKF